MVERIVDDIDDIVRQIRFTYWQSTEGGMREVCKALRHPSNIADHPLDGI